MGVMGQKNRSVTLVGKLKGAKKAPAKKSAKKK